MFYLLLSDSYNSKVYVWWHLLYNNNEMSINR